MERLEPKRIHGRAFEGRIHFAFQACLHQTSRTNTARGICGQVGTTVGTSIFFSHDNLSFLVFAVSTYYQGKQAGRLQEIDRIFLTTWPSETHLKQDSWRLFAKPAQQASAAKRSRISSSICSGVLTVWAISSRSISRYRLRSR